MASAEKFAVCRPQQAPSSVALARRGHSSMQECILRALRHPPPSKFWPADWTHSQRFEHGRQASLRAGVDAAMMAAVDDEADLWVEFGAWMGETTRLIASTGHHVHSFDSFRGLPEKWRDANAALNPADRATFTTQFLSKGSFSRRGRPPFPDAPGTNITWHVGWFSETLPRFLEENPERNVSFVHIDCDLYVSASAALRLLAPRLAPRAILVFDELINYAEFEQHEMRALVELATGSGRAVRMIGTPALHVCVVGCERFTHETTRWGEPRRLSSERGGAAHVKRSYL
jgi:hypothetical protein